MVSREKNSRKTCRYGKGSACFLKARKKVSKKSAIEGQKEQIGAQKMKQLRKERAIIDCWGPEKGGNVFENAILSCLRSNKAVNLSEAISYAENVLKLKHCDEMKLKNPAAAPADRSVEPLEVLYFEPSQAKKFHIVKLLRGKLVCAKPKRGDEKRSSCHMGIIPNDDVLQRKRDRKLIAVPFPHVFVFEKRITAKKALIPAKLTSPKGAKKESCPPLEITKERRLFPAKKCLNCAHSSPCKREPHTAFTTARWGRRVKSSLRK
jgi:hypothetical protein